MLFAKLNETTIMAEHGTPRTDEYVCPLCEAPVVLKDGEVLTTHFAHKDYDINCANSHVDINEQRQQVS